MKFAQWFEENDSVLYHGSDSEKIVGNLYSNDRDSGWFGSGFYLTAYPDYALRWGKYVHKMIPPFGKFAIVNCSQDYKCQYLGDAENANQFAGGTTGWVENEDLWSQKFKSFLANLGYVGIRVNIGEHPDVEIVIFDPSKIRVLQ